MAASVVSSAAQWIGSLLMQEASILYNVEDEVRALQEELELMQQYLQDADAKQQAVREVGTLIAQIRKLAYDTEDVIDTYILKVPLLESTDQQSLNRSLLMRFAQFIYIAPHSYVVGKQIQMIQSRVKRITDKLNGYGVRRMISTELHDEEGFRSSKKKPRSYSYDDVDGEYVVGLGKDMEDLVQVLMGERKKQIHVLSIVGMGGSGKTTLAKKLYNHPHTKECFDCMAWVFVSQDWSTQHVLFEILRRVTGTSSEVMSNARLGTSSTVEELVDKLRNTLRTKSYLVVLDDVWRREALQEILPALPKGSIDGGSKIIITTRNREILQLQNLWQNVHIHEIQPLNEEESWELFSKIALNSHDRTNYTIMESFERLGKEMLEKCDGLPLAIVALAGILRTRGSIREWQQVSQAVLSRVMERTCMHTSGYGRVGDLLALSYDDLPYDLKPCFLYLGMFPEDCRIPAGMLIRMWVAEGLVTAHARMSLEDVAMQHLEELSHRFLIEVVRTNFMGEIKAISMHDLLRDLCVRIAKEQSFLEIYTPLHSPALTDVPVPTIRPRRAALHSSISFPRQVSSLRSITLLTRSRLSHSAYVSNKEIVDLGVVHHNYKLLRLLNLWGIETLNGTLPSQIGSLIHLRYLGIRSSNITELPRSLANLRNLLTLDYRNVDSGIPIKIPNILWKLQRLRHLFLPIECPWSKEVHFMLRTMKNLRTLWGMKQEGEGHWFSGELMDLSTSLKKLKIFVSRESDLKAAFSCPSLMSDGLQTFHCELTRALAFSNVEPLCHRHHLHKLTLSGNIQMEFSLLLPTNIVVLKLKDSQLKGLDPMKALGRLTHLKLLRMSNTYLGTTFACDQGSFPRLEELYLQNFRFLETWTIEMGSMLCLKKIEILACSKLKHFPKGLAFVTTLQQLEFFGVPKEFGQEAREHGWSRKSLRLPHNYEAIIEQCDSPIDASSIGWLYEQLTAGVLLNNEKQKYWVLEQNERYYNCFMLYAKDLLPDKAVFDPLVDRPLPPPLRDVPNLDECWQYSCIAESCGYVEGIKVKAYHDELQVHGKFNTEYISPQVIYEVAYVIMLTKSSSGNHHLGATESVLSLSNGHLQRQVHMLDDKPKGEWIRISIGEVKTSPKNTVGEIQFCLHHIEPGVLIKGVVIEPKLKAF